MKKKLISIMTVVLSLVLVFTSCSTKTDKKKDQTGDVTTDGAKGRFLEKKIAISDDEDMMVDSIHQLTDGTLVASIFDTKKIEELPEEQRVPMNKTFRVSSDQGKTWTDSKDFDWINEIVKKEKLDVMSLTLIDSKLAYANCIKIDPEFDKAFDKAFEANDNEKIRELNKQRDEQYFLAKLTPDKVETTEQYPKLTVESEVEQFGGYRSLRVLDNGDLVIQFYEGIGIFDAKTGEEKHSFLPDPPEGEMFGMEELYYTTYGNKVAIIKGTTIEIYDAEKKEELDSIELGEETGFSNFDNYNKITITYHEKEKSFYATNNAGLYRITEDGSLVEKVIDGSLNSMAISSTDLSELYVNDDNTFVIVSMGWGRGTSTANVLYYEYDPDVLTVPSKELHIYSIYEDWIFQSIIGQFQISHPDIKVVYDVGISWEEEEPNTADALRKLSTEILAGNGPDIIILDSLPIDSYIDKGVLLDLTDFVEEQKSKEKYFENILNTYKKDNKIYAIPTGFGIPTIVGEDVGTINSLAEFRTWYEKHNDPKNPMLSRDNIDALFPYLYKGWVKADGTLNEAQLETDLKELEKLLPILGKDMENATVYQGGSVDYQAIYWKAGVAKLLIGNIEDVDGVIMLHNAKDQGAKGEVRYLGDKDEKYYVPKNTLGINANSKETEVAKEFIAFAMSYSNPDHNSSGLPVSKTAFDNKVAATKKAYGEEGMSMGVGMSRAVDVEDGEEGDEEDSTQEETLGEEMYEDFFMTAVFPPDSVIEDFVKYADTVNVPLTSNIIVTEIIGQEIGNATQEEPYDLSTALKTIKEKVGIYLAEA